MTTIRGSSVYWKGRRLGLVEEGNYDESSGGETSMTEDGMYRSTGIATTTVSITKLNTVGGESAADDINVDDYESLIIAMSAGKRLSADMWCTKNSATWNHGNGTNKGTLEFTGPRFERIG